MLAFEPSTKIHTTMRRIHNQMLFMGLLFFISCGQDKKESSPDQKLLNSAMAYLDFSRQHKNYFDVINFFITSPGTYFGSDLMTRIHSKGSSILGYIATIVEEGKQKDTLNENSPERYAIFFWASLHGLILMKKMQKNTILENEDYDSFFTYSVERLINSIKIN